VKKQGRWVVFGLAMALCFIPRGTGSNGWAQTQTWIDELSNSVSFYAVSYPESNWQPYQDRLTVIRDAVSRGDQSAVRTEMTKWFEMLRQRKHGINDVAADELFNFALMVTPIQEYNIAVPTAGGSGF